MALANLFTRLSVTRRLLRSLDRLAAAQERSAIALERIADHVAPKVQPLTDLSPAEQKITGVTYSDLDEQFKTQEFIERCVQEAGREPTPEEIDRFLEGEEVRL